MSSFLNMSSFEVIFLGVIFLFLAVIGPFFFGQGKSDDFKKGYRVGMTGALVSLLAVISSSWFFKSVSITFL